MKTRYIIYSMSYREIEKIKKEILKIYENLKREGKVTIIDYEGKGGDYSLIDKKIYMTKIEDIGSVVHEVIHLIEDCIYFEIENRRKKIIDEIKEDFKKISPYFYDLFEIRYMFIEIENINIYKPEFFSHLFELLIDKNKYNVLKKEIKRNTMKKIVDYYRDLIYFYNLHNS